MIIGKDDQNRAIAGGLARLMSEFTILPFQITEIDRYLFKRKQLSLTNMVRMMVYDGFSSVFQGGILTFFGYFVQGGTHFLLYDEIRKVISLQFGVPFRSELNVFLGALSSTAFVSYLDYKIVKARLNQCIISLLNKNIGLEQQSELFPKYTEQISKFNASGISEFRQANQSAIQKTFAHIYDNSGNFMKSRIYLQSSSFFMYEIFSRFIENRVTSFSLNQRERLTISFFSGWIGGVLYSLYEHSFSKNQLINYIQKKTDFNSISRNFQITIFKYSNYSAFQWVIYDYFFRYLATRSIKN